MTDSDKNKTVNDVKISATETWPDNKVACDKDTYDDGKLRIGRSVDAVVPEVSVLPNGKKRLIIG